MRILTWERVRIAPLFSAPENGANHTQISLIAITDQILLLVHILQKSQIFFPVLCRAFSIYFCPSYLPISLLTHLVGHCMRKLALSQADGSQAGTEPEFDPHCTLFECPGHYYSTVTTSAPLDGLGAC